MRLVVLEPSGAQKRRVQGGAWTHISDALLGTTGLSVDGRAVEGAEARSREMERRRERLLRLREAVCRDPLAAVAGAVEALEAAGLKVVMAPDARAAAAAVASFAGPRSMLVTNNSSAIKEISPALQAAGLRTLSGYPGRSLPSPAPAITRGWQLPRQPAAVAGAAFVEHLPPPRLDGGPHARRDMVALLGVSALAGPSVYWVQHFENITRALHDAGRLVLIVPVDKVVPSSADATLQAEMAAAYGWAARILDAPGPEASAEAESVWQAAPPWEEPPRVLVVILDNGRSAQSGSEYAPLLRCVSCRGCRKDCPTQRFFGGDLAMSPVEYVRFYLQGLHDDLELCVGCGNCSRACPVDIDIPGLIARARQARGGGHYARDFALLNPELVGRLGRPVMAGSSGGRRAGALAQAALGIHRDTRLPSFGRESFFEWAQRHPVLDSSKRVVLFSGCFVNYHDLEQGIATVRLLERAGFAVDVPRHHCCEIPKLQGGFWGKARRRARANLEVLSRDIAGAEAIVTGCPSCARALTEFYPDVLGPEAAWLRQSVRELFRFLRESGLEVGSGEGLAAPPRRLLYHTPCHYPGVDPQLSVLGFLKDLGTEVTEADRGCCGMSGSFGLKARHHDRAMEVGRDLFARARETGFESVVTNCGACKLQLQQGSGRSVPHAAVVIDGLIQGGVA
ncbi:MAG: heterodisulfide reductase-related iron-sulfur binding cluster [Thermoleophilia bacterium]|nr:heterodisulfide reductase-related iron-sulfur binding cluster [Thermoleophilia bacterium]